MSKKLEKLTPEQEAMMEPYAQKFIALAFDTGEINKTATEDYIRLVCGLDSEYPKDFPIRYVDSPLAVKYYINLYAIVMEKLGKVDSSKTILENLSQVYGTSDREEILKQVDKVEFFNTTLSYYSDISNYSWVAFYKFFEEIGILDHKLFKDYSDAFIASNLYQFAKLPTEVVVCRKPLEIHRDGQDRLNNTSAPAVVWKDGFKQYFVKGVEVPSSWIESGVTVNDIEKESNAELRRIGMELYGYKNYMQDSNAERIAVDEYGELWKKEVPDDEPIVMVSVLNCSPEPEEAMGLEQRYEFRETEISKRGAWFKRYMLRVPPDTKTPLEGLARCARVSEEQYKRRLVFES